MDDAYVGDSTYNGKLGRGMDKSKIVIGLSKSKADEARFVRMQTVSELRTETL